MDDITVTTLAWQRLGLLTASLTVGHPGSVWNVGERASVIAHVRNTSSSRLVNVEARLIIESNAYVEPFLDPNGNFEIGGWWFWDELDRGEIKGFPLVAVASSPGTARLILRIEADVIPRASRYVAIVDEQIVQS